MNFLRSYYSLALAAALVLAGPAILVFGAASPFVRNYYYIPLASCLVGGMLAMSHAITRRSRVSWIAGPLVEGIGIFIIVMFLLAIRIPETGVQPRAGSPAPPFTLLDSAGESVSLSQVYKTGPAMIVFFRGVW